MRGSRQPPQVIEARRPLPPPLYGRVATRPSPTTANPATRRPNPIHRPSNTPPFVGGAS